MSAEAVKDEGNLQFKNKKYFSAYECYCRALQLCDPENTSLLAIIQSNKAAVALILERPSDAIQAATASLEINPNNEKALFRRGDAYFQSLDFEGAYNDYLAAAKLKPNVKFLRDRMEQAKQKLLAQNYRKAMSQETKAHELQRPKTPVIIDDGNIKDSFTLESAKEFMYQMAKMQRPNESSVLSILTKMRHHHVVLPNIVYLNKPHITIVGDTHGQFQDVIGIFENFGFPSKDNPYLFNGDFVDRGSMGVEIVLTLLAFKIADEDSIFLNRGNHESNAMNAMYGFEKECTDKYSKSTYDQFSLFFDSLPLGTIINNRVLVVHGGLPCRTECRIEDIQKEDRKRQPPDNGPLNDILWSDPMPENGTRPSPRGVTHTFGPDITEKFLNENNLELIIRSHQVMENGYEEMHNGKCVTVFSAPNYIGMMNNRGALVKMDFDEDGTIKTKKYETFGDRPIPKDFPPMKYAAMGF